MPFALHAETVPAQDVQADMQLSVSGKVPCETVFHQRHRWFFCQPHYTVMFIKEDKQHAVTTPQLRSTCTFGSLVVYVSSMPWQTKS